MNKFLLTLFIAVLSLVAVAQDSTTTLPKKESKKTDLDKKFAKYSKDRISVSLQGVNWIYNPNGPGMNGMRTKWFSRGLALAFSWDFRIKHSRVSIAPGIGYSLYTINNRSQMVEDSAGIHFKPLVNESNYKINSITLQHFEIPIELRIRTNPDKFDNMWKVAIGFKAGVRIDVHTKQAIRDVNVTPSPSTPDVKTSKIQIQHKFPDFNRFRFGPTLRIGYSVFNITAYYGVLDVFKPNRGPKANEFSVGLTFSGL